ALRCCASRAGRAPPVATARGIPSAHARLAAWGAAARSFVRRATCRVGRRLAATLVGTAQGGFAGTGRVPGRAAAQRVVAAVALGTGRRLTRRAVLGRAARSLARGDDSKFKRTRLVRAVDEDEVGGAPLHLDRGVEVEHVGSDAAHLGAAAAVAL